MVRLSCAIEENGLLGSGAGNSQRMFVASSYFGTLSTEANAAFKEQYYRVHGEQAPMLNALGQSTYEGVHYLAGLMSEHVNIWRDHSVCDAPPVVHKSGRSRSVTDEHARATIYLARADGLRFEVINGFSTTDCELSFSNSTNYLNWKLN